MIKKRIYIIGLFVISFIFISIALIQNIRPKSAIGTYCTGEGLSRDDVYISLLSDNTFLIYRQLETGLSGKFDSEEFENLTTLTFQLEDGRQLLATYVKCTSPDVSTGSTWKSGTKTAKSGSIVKTADSTKWYYVGVTNASSDPITITSVDFTF